MVDYNIFEKVLFVGMEYKIPKGGIASVLNTYSTFISPFKFIRTAASELNTMQKVWFALRGYVLCLWRLLIDRKIKIVHIHSASGSSFWRKSYIIRLAKLMRKKVIFHCHGGGFKEFRQNAPLKVDAILNKVDCVVCLSKEWEVYFKNIGCKNVFVIKNVIDEPMIEDVEKDGLVHFLFLGLICDNKGIFDVLQTLSDHKDELRGKMLLHVGGNGETNRLELTIKQLKLDELVKFEGWVAKEKKKELFNLSDVYMLPSYIEGVPISILEAESYHKPIITTNIGGIPSIVKNNITGLFITPGNRHEIYQAIKRMIENQDIRHEFGEAGYKISTDYLPSSVIKSLINLYQNIL